MNDNVAQTAIRISAFILLAGSAVSQTTSPPMANTTAQVITFESNLSTLYSGTQTVDRRASGTGITTMRLERNASGQLVKAIVFARFASNTAQPETYTQFQIGRTGSMAITIPLVATQTVPGQTSVSTTQVEITDAATLAQIEQFLLNPSAFTMYLGDGTAPGSQSGPIVLPDTTLLSRTETRLQVVSTLDRAIYRLLIRIAASSGIISQNERDSMITELATLSLRLDQADRLGTGIITSESAAASDAVGIGTANP